MKNNEVATWREVSEDMFAKIGESSLSRDDVAKYLNCSKSTATKFLSNVPFRGNTVGRRWNVLDVAKAYVADTRKYTANY